MKNKTLDTLHPLLGLVLTVFATFAMVVMQVVNLTLNSSNHSTLVSTIGFTLVNIVMLSIVVYCTYRLRAIDFDGNEFYLENAFYKSVTIDAKQFNRIEGIIYNIYRIKFNDGRSYLFALSPFAFPQTYNDYLSWETDPYERRLTKRVREAIEQSKQAGDVHQG